MVSRERSLLAGVTAAALMAVVGVAEVVIAEVGERTISLYNIHTKETVTVVYKKGGKYVEAGLERVNHALRDHRRNEATKMDPELATVTAAPDASAYTFKLDPKAKFHDGHPLTSADHLQHLNKEQSHAKRFENVPGRDPGICIVDGARG